MKTVEEYKNEFNSLKNNISDLLKKTKLKFTVDEFLNFDSIAYNSLTTIELNIDPKILAKQDYLILGNERYFTEDENFRRIEKKTRTTLFSIKKSKLLKLDDNEVFDMLIDYIKLIEAYKRYKILRKDLDNFIYLKFPDITTWSLLIGLYGIDFCDEKINELANDEYFDFIDLQRDLQKEEQTSFRNRSLKLEEKLTKKK